MRSAPTLKIWMTPFASVAMLEKLALLKIALCRAPAFSRTSLRRTSVTISSATESPSRIGLCFIFVPCLNCDWPCFVFSLAAAGARERRSHSTLARLLRLGEVIGEVRADQLLARQSSGLDTMMPPRAPRRSAATRGSGLLRFESAPGMGGRETDRSVQAGSIDDTQQ